MRVDDVGMEAPDEARERTEGVTAQEGLDRHGLGIHADAAQIGREPVEQRRGRSQPQAELGRVQPAEQAEHDFFDTAAHRRGEHEEQSDGFHAACSRTARFRSSSRTECTPVMWVTAASTGTVESRTASAVGSLGW